jgi:hypothetical protein
MAWIKFETCTSDKPEVWQIAQSLGIDPDAVVGKLLRVWAWFDEQTEDGNAPSVTKALLDRNVGVTGFVTSMLQVGWMVEKDGQLSIPNFGRHNGDTAKKRALTAKRVSESRGNSKDVTQVKQNCNATSVTGALPREEKIREREEEKKDNTNPPLPPKGERLKFDASKVSLPIQTEAFREAWLLWCQHRAEIKKPLKPTSCEQQLKQLAEWGEARAIAAIRYTVAKGWQGIQEPDTSKRNGKIYNPEVGDIF